MNTRRAIGPNGEVDIVGLHPIYANTLLVQSDTQAKYAGYSLLDVDELVLKHPRVRSTIKGTHAVPPQLQRHIIPIR